MATLERGNHPKERPLTGTVTLKQSVENNLPENTYPDDPTQKREGGEGARIRNDSQSV